jgi:hypothetical protein
MAKKSMNMISLMNYAWDQRQKVSAETYQEQCRNLLSHAYVDLNNLYADYCTSEGIKNDEIIFISFQHIFVFIMLSDGDFLQGEYDAYCKYCGFAGFKPLSVADCRSLYARLTVDDLAGDIGFISKLREATEPDKYEAMVLAFCYLCLQGDKEMDENEYYILRCFFEQGYDYAPSTWQQFKDEW